MHLMRDFSDFGSTLRQIKSCVLPDGRHWYPFDILSGLYHLDTVLSDRCRARLQNLTGQCVVDIGGADGDLAFFLESAGCDVDLIDNASTNMNNLHGAKALRDRLGSSVSIHDIDLDQQFHLPREYDFAFFLGILYHLKNPYYVLERLAHDVGEMVLSTRIAAYTAPPGAEGRTLIRDLPVAYLLETYKSNQDYSNFWVFSESGLRLALDRTGWRIDEFGAAGNPDSDPYSVEGDQRAFCLLTSQTYKSRVDRSISRPAAK